MEKLRLEEQKKVMLDILIYIDKVAREHDLTYSLWGGTLLGSVRHKGFIPWDDDIDISLPRKDYNKLLFILRNQDNYDLYENTCQKEYTWGWAKLTDKNTVDKKRKFLSPSSSPGVFVDIIPIDGLPTSELDIKKHKKNMYRLNLMMKSSIFPYYASSIYVGESLKKLILLFPIYAYTKFSGGKMRIVKKINQLSTKYTLENSVNCGHVLSRYKSNLGYPSTIWNSMSEYEFEGYLFKGISDSHSYLSLLYGDDYMELPPVEKRIVHKEHDFFIMEGDDNEYRDDYGKWKRSENGTKYSKTVY